MMINLLMVYVIGFIISYFWIYNDAGAYVRNWKDVPMMASIWPLIFLFLVCVSCLSAVSVVYGWIKK